MTYTLRDRTAPRYNRILREIGAYRTLFQLPDDDCP